MVTWGGREREFRFRLDDTELTFRLSSPTVVLCPLAPRPLRADARRNRERVLAAARVVFAEHGHEAQMDDVARRAGVGVGTVYRHFPTKEALIEALALDASSAVAWARRRWSAPIRGRHSPRRCGRVRSSARDRAFTEIMGELPGPMPMAAEIEQDMNNTLGELMRRAQASGELRPDLVIDDVAMFMCGIGSAPASHLPRRLAPALDDHHRRPAGRERLGAASDLLS